MTPEIFTAAIAPGQTLRNAGQSIAVAESASAGLISAALLSVPGASAYFRGGSVVYTNAARKTLLGITRAQVQGLEPLTEQMALQFARQARAQLETDWGLAELGAAGPTGTPYGHPAGISVIAIAGPLERTMTVSTGSSVRIENMQRFTMEALRMLLNTLTEAESG